MIVKIAVPVPLRRVFDYLLPDDEVSHSLIGRRVRVSFGKQSLVGIIVETNQKSDLAPHQLKIISEVLDETPVISKKQLEICKWASDYYQAPIGEVISCCLPKLLRQGNPCQYRQQRLWMLTQKGKTESDLILQRAKKQKQALSLIRSAGNGLADHCLREEGITTTVVKQLEEKQLIVAKFSEHLPQLIEQKCEPPLTLNKAQKNAYQTIAETINEFKVHLLDGVTGSGKTEIYLQVIREVLDANKQVLVLVPEIGLTPQTVRRFTKRFPVPIAVLHSRMNDRERLDNWLMANDESAKIIIGTRSAIFSNIPKLGLIIIDEEHDTSFKQQEGFRYHARDLAIKYAYLNQFPVILGSATPALETYHNAMLDRYQHLLLPQRAGSAKKPSYHLIDLRHDKAHNGLTQELKNEITAHLDAGNQVLLFLNRRGYSPVLMCSSCGWLADCRHCDAHLTLHSQPSYLSCHHCGSTQRVIHQCPECSYKKLAPIGLGTERLESELESLFPNHPILRVDQDSTRRKGSLDALLAEIETGKSQILLGTQMLAKGHHFPNVTLVGILDADNGLYSVDFRALERLAQLIEQVAGRAGRAEKPGHVYIQTHNPHNVLLTTLLKEGYGAFAKAQLAERQAAHLPPFTYLALFRSEAKRREDSIAVLETIKQKIQPLLTPDLQLLGPIAAPMEKRADRYRMQLLLKAAQRGPLHRLLKKIMPIIEKQKQLPRHTAKWTLDVDPSDIY